MNDEIDAALSKTVKAMQLWEEQKTTRTAMDLEFQLSVMKLMVGIDKFDELPNFSRVLREVTSWLDAREKNEKKSLQNGQDLI